MSAAFTPGPWEVLHDGGYGTVPGYSIGGGVFIVALAIGDLEKIPAEANARLIAAAPELYEALEALLPHTFTGPRNDARDIAHWERERELGNGEASRVLAAYAALAKARGEA